VDVLQHEQRGVLEPFQRRRGDAPGIAVDVEPEVEERPVRRRRRQVLAGASQSPPVRLCEGPDERGLPDSGLAADEGEPAPCPTELLELGQQPVAFQ
jgi:hypothetical protein